MNNKHQTTGAGSLENTKQEKMQTTQTITTLKPRHIIFNWRKPKTKSSKKLEKYLQCITYRELQWITVNFLSETSKVKREWSKIFKITS